MPKTSRVLLGVESTPEAEMVKMGKTVGYRMRTPAGVVVRPAIIVETCGPEIVNGFQRLNLAVHVVPFLDGAGPHPVMYRAAVEYGGPLSTMPNTWTEV